MKNSQRYWRLKYVLEWIIAFIAVVILSPLFILIAVLEKLLDGGDIFYVSTRIGLKGERFKLYKFRGMISDAKPIITKDLKFVTIENDPRITRLGRILRLGFDELAQLFNVLKGEMCIIGPRPNLQWEETLYDDRERKRLSVLPGITGLAQILDGRALHLRDNYELDVRYVENSNWYTDLLILIFTVPYSFGHKKFYRRFFKKYLENIPCQRTLDDLDGKIEKKLTRDTVYL
jgi:undecaprenyl phosphate N,N'-diacetylbacillosamine 1-phosphate transferase